MRKSNTQPLGDVLREYIRSRNMEGKLKELDVVASWELLLGKTIAHYTRNIYLKKILYVELSSSVVKNELVMMREKIRERLNEQAGEEMVEKIVFK